MEYAMYTIKDQFLNALIPDNENWNIRLFLHVQNNPARSNFLTQMKFNEKSCNFYKDWKTVIISK